MHAHAHADLPTQRKMHVKNCPQGTVEFYENGYNEAVWQIERQTRLGENWSQSIALNFLLEGRLGWKNPSWGSQSWRICNSSEKKRMEDDREEQAGADLADWKSPCDHKIQGTLKDKFASWGTFKAPFAA